MLSLLLLPLGFLSDGEAVDYGRDVRPILSQYCYPCHGPDSATREAELRLDRADVLGDDRHILVPGDPEASELFYRVTTDSEFEKMPPAASKKTLTSDQRDILKRWIQQGASYEDHWSFRPIGNPEPPAMRSDWPRNAIDRFVLARLEAAGLEPSPEADRRTLIRRWSLDLTGLPPTPEEVEAFVNDDRPDAAERVVDRLLSSIAFAERMTLAWMDAARYGDTSVFHADGPRDMWPWRDWVMRAYHRNMPFDQFTLEQLAGDLLTEPTREQLVATGFLRNNGTSDEGGAIDEELRVSYHVDRVKTVGNVWLGLSTECAQCHEHKYDPIGQDDYYRLFAFFNQSVEPGFQTRNGNAEPTIPVPSAEQERREQEITADIAALERWLSEVEAPEAALSAWTSEQRQELLALDPPTLSPWQALGPFQGPSSKAVFQKEYGPESGVDLEATVEGHTWTPRPDLADGKVQPLGLPANSALYLTRTIHVEQPGERVVSLGSDDTIQVWLNGESLLSKESYRAAQADQDRVTLKLEPGDNTFLFKICNGAGDSGLYFKLLGLPLPDPVIAALKKDAAARTDAERRAIRDHWVRSVWDEGQQRQSRIGKQQKALTELRQSIPTTMIMRDLEEGRPTFVLARGQYDSPKADQPVEPGVLENLLPLPDAAPRNRLGLASWLIDPDHPLTARVAVNRYWSMLFGHGLVRTVMDFGSQGEFPSHPSLLDWLARDFIESGWDIKRAIRQIVLSSTYRQQSIAPEVLRDHDPENRLLARASRFRLQGELVRDLALSVSGLLVDRPFGPGVKPYQPEGLWNEVSLNKNVRFSQDHGEALYRKSMYIYWKRSAPMPVMTIFDAPTREKCTVERQRTNTPLQALVTLNDIQFVEAARHLAERMIAAGDDFDTRLRYGFELCTSRPPDDKRRRVMREIFDAQWADYAKDPTSADLLVSVGESDRDGAIDPVEHATWTVLASILLNLDETMNRE
ncbi:MAG: PSD1 and planctomycete cytochrome C domain-containing protein [Planctomycetota bacterium]